MKITLLVLAWVAMMAAFTHPSRVFGATFGDKEAIVTRVHDGDSLTVSISDWPEVIGVKMPVRVLGTDTPELSGKCLDEKERAVLAKAFTTHFVSDKQVKLKNIQRDKYFRLLADVYVGDKSLSEELIKENLARPYFGGKKTSWCNP